MAAQRHVKLFRDGRSPAVRAMKRSCTVTATLYGATGTMNVERFRSRLVADRGDRLSLRLSRPVKFQSHVQTPLRRDATGHEGSRFDL